MSDLSKLIFDAANGQFAVFTCACGCDGTVEVTPLMLEEAQKARFYIRGHQPLGCAYQYVGRRYEFEARTETHSPALQSLLDADPLSAPITDRENATRGLPGALDDEWDKDAKTPALHFADFLADWDTDTDTDTDF